MESLRLPLWIVAVCVVVITVRYTVWPPCCLRVYPDVPMVVPSDTIVMVPGDTVGMIPGDSISFRHAGTTSKRRLPSTGLLLHR